MFNLSFEKRVSRHLGVFDRAVTGLKKVREDIHQEINKRTSDKVELTQKIREHDATVLDLFAHSGKITETIGKIDSLLPQKASPNGQTEKT